MKYRPFSVFSLIAYLLIGLAIYGFIRGRSFVFDPGQSVGTKADWYMEPIYYLITGVLMFLNGLWSPVTSPDQAGGTKSGEKQDENKQKSGDRHSRAAAAAAAAEARSRK